MCYLQPLPMEGPKGKKAKSKKPKTGVEVVQDVLKTPNPQMNEPFYEDMMYSCGIQPKPATEQKIVNNPLPTYEEMVQACGDLNDLSMQTQPPVEPLYYIEEGMGEQKCIRQPKINLVCSTIWQMRKNLYTLSFY